MEQIQKIVVTGFLFNEEKTLILKRSSQEKFFPEYWELPGGKLEFGEDPSSGLVREYKEEAGLTIEVGTPYRTFSYLSNDGSRYTVEIVYTCSFFGGEINISSAHTEFAWITENDIKKYQISEETEKSIQAGFGIFN